jgi:ribosomal 50S subunit-associated protein YjgA (DUF615 family)
MRSPSGRCGGMIRRQARFLGKPVRRLDMETQRNSLKKPPKQALFLSTYMHI